MGLVARAIATALSPLGKGTERPGAGSKTDPRTGRWYDDLKPMIDGIEWLDDDGRELIYAGNVPEVFPRYNAR